MIRLFHLQMAPWPSIAFLFAAFGVGHAAEENEMFCAYQNNKVSTLRYGGRIVIELNELNVTVESATERCLEDTQFCYTFWQVDPTVVVLMQGCWDNKNKQACPTNDCVANSPISREEIRNSTRFCCCIGNMCNVNVTDNVNFTAFEMQRRALEELARESAYPNGDMHIIIIVACVGTFVILGSFTILLYRCYRRTEKDGDLEASLFLVPPSSGLAFGKLDLDDLKPECMIHRGRYGEVCKALLNDAEVAVKSLYPSHRQYYYNERDIYMLDCMQHENIAKFCGYYERSAEVEAPAQYMIVTAYMEHSTLTSYLKNNTVSWQTMSRMWHSMASGLAHLHTEIIIGDKIKPTIAHRDFNSRNILVKPDLACCICDFGLAMKILTPRLTSSSGAGGDHDEHLSLADVGTLRYMAPEVLEGSVNLFDCKTSLTQVDIYSLGLVFWEVATRCHDLYQGLPTPEYRLPFEVEAGVHPSFEDMQVLVSRNKARPLFPDIWKDSNLAIRSMKDTIEECWDQDPEARVSSVCVEERSREMGAMWDNWHRCMTPTINFSRLKDLEDKATVQHNLTFSNSSGSVSSLTTGAVSTIQGSEPTASTSGQSSSDAVTTHNPSVTYPKEQSTSTATIETMMTLSPSETYESSGSTRLPPATTTGKPDCNLIYAKTNMARQPHQGQNPTVERNTHKSSDEELAVEGNTLVNKCRVTSTAQQNGNLIDSGALLLDAIARSGDSRALVQNDILDFQNQNTLAPNATVERPLSGRVLSANRPQHRISFVPNPVDTPSGQVLSEPLVRPKKQNIPSNGAVNYSVARPVPAGDKTSNKSQSKKLVFANKSPSFRKFSFPSFGFGRRGKPNQTNGAAKENRNNGEVRQISSEVFLVDGRTVVRPNSLALNGVCGVPNERHVSNINLQSAGFSENREEPIVASGNSPSSEHVNGNNLSNCVEVNSSEIEQASEIVNAVSSNGNSVNSIATNSAAVTQTMQNEDGTIHSSVPGDISAGANPANKSLPHSERSVSDNMAYEASCSPVNRVNACVM